MRVPVARRNLFSELTRLLISVGGVAVAILLIIILLGIYRGSVTQMTAYVDNTAADLWVAQAGTPDMIHSSSIIAASLEGEFDAMAGVAEAYPLTSRIILTEIGEVQNSLIIVGSDPATEVGGPWRIIEGRGDPGPGEIVLDQVTMELNGFGVGDPIELDDKAYEIIGVSGDTTLIVAQYAFVNIEEARQLLGPDRINFMLIQLDDPAGAESVRAEIEAAHPELVVYTSEEFARNNSATIRNGILPILAVIVVIAFIIGVVIVGLVVYSATLEKYREYGVLKAVGASGGQLYRIVLEQSLLSSMLGFAVGAASSFLVARAISRVVVQISVVFNWQQFASAALAALVMSVVASYIPIRKINSIDPVIVFKA